MFNILRARLAQSWFWTYVALERLFFSWQRICRNKFKQVSFQTFSSPPQHKSKYSPKLQLRQYRGKLIPPSPTKCILILSTLVCMVRGFEWKLQTWQEEDCHNTEIEASSALRIPEPNVCEPFVIETYLLSCPQKSLIGNGCQPRIRPKIDMNVLRWKHSCCPFQARGQE